MWWGRSRPAHRHCRIALPPIYSGRSYRCQFRAPTATSNSACSPNKRHRSPASFQWRPVNDESLVLAEAVEEKEEEHGEETVDECPDEQVHVKPRLRLRQENAPRENDQALMRHEESGGEREPRRGMLGVQPRPDGGSEIPDDGFGDAVETEWNRGAAQAILRETYGHAKKKSCRRIAPAESEIDSHQQREIQ